MLLSQLIHYLRGYVVIRVSGRYPERFLNVCAARGILIWDAARLSDQAIRLKISMRGFRMLPPIANKTGVRVKILAKRGLPAALFKYRRRKILLAGAAAFLLAVICLNQFVWDIEIIGNENVSSGEILKTLEECGLYIGQLRFRADPRKIKNDMLIKMPELSWLWAEKSGSRVVVSVKERRPVPEIFDPEDYCSVVAAKDGVIDSMIVRGGAPAVKAGDTVQKGAVLVSGMITSERGIPARYVQAEAEVYARTWYEKTRAFSLVKTENDETGESEKKWRLRLFGLSVPLFWRAEPSFSEYLHDEEKHDLSFFGRYLGVSLCADIYRETVRREVTLERDSVIESGTREVEDEIDGMTLPDSERLRSAPSYRDIDSETVEVTVIAEYLENIAQKVKMEKPEIAEEQGNNVENADDGNADSAENTDDGENADGGAGGEN